MFCTCQGKSRIWLKFFNNAAKKRQSVLKTILESGSRVVSRLTVVIQREVILGVAEFLWSTRDENIVLTKEILKASNLLCRKTKDMTT